jgi:hypothetical protein
MIELYVDKIINRGEGNPLTPDDQKRVISRAFDTFLTVGGTTYFVNMGQLAPISTNAQFYTMFDLWSKITFPDLKIREWSAEEGKYIENMNIPQLLHLIKSINSFSSMRYESDPFIRENRVIRSFTTGIVTIITSGIHIHTPQLEMSNRDYQEIVTDYIDHFPQFDTLIDMVADFRIAQNRKSSFLYLNLPSNFGKSFLMAIFKGVEVGISLQYDDFLNTSTSSISPIQVRNSFAMFVDEFKVFQKEMKELGHTFSIAPKYGMREEVEVYLKILMSAEESISFSGAVDDQIKNRVMVWKDIDSPSLDSRDIFNKHGAGKYKSALMVYVSNRLRARIDEYLKMPKFKAQHLADSRVIAYRDNYRLQAENIEDKILETVRNEVYDIINNPTQQVPYANNIHHIDNGKYSGKVLIKKPDRTIQDILRTTLSDSEYKKVKYKLNSISSIFKVDSSSKVIKIGGRSHRGAVIDFGFYV